MTGSQLGRFTALRASDYRDREFGHDTPIRRIDKYERPSTTATWLTRRIKGLPHYKTMIRLQEEKTPSQVIRRSESSLASYSSRTSRQTSASHAQSQPISTRLPTADRSKSVRERRTQMSDWLSNMSRVVEDNVTVLQLDQVYRMAVVEALKRPGTAKEWTRPQSTPHHLLGADANNAYRMESFSATGTESQASSYRSASTDEVESEESETSDEDDSENDSFLECDNEKDDIVQLPEISQSTQTLRGRRSSIVVDHDLSEFVPEDKPALDADAVAGVLEGSVEDVSTSLGDILPSANNRRTRRPSLPALQLTNSERVLVADNRTTSGSLAGLLQQNHSTWLMGGPPSKQQVEEESHAPACTLLRNQVKYARLSNKFINNQEDEYAKAPVAEESEDSDSDPFDLDSKEKGDSQTSVHDRRLQVRQLGRLREVVRQLQHVLHTTMAIPVLGVGALKGYERGLDPPLPDICKALEPTQQDTNNNNDLPVTTETTELSAKEVDEKKFIQRIADDHNAQVTLMDAIVTHLNPQTNVQRGDYRRTHVMEMARETAKVLVVNKTKKLNKLQEQPPPPPSTPAPRLTTSESSNKPILSDRVMRKEPRILSAALNPVQNGSQHLEQGTAAGTVASTTNPSPTRRTSVTPSATGSRRASTLSKLPNLRRMSAVAPMARRLSTAK